MLVLTTVTRFDVGTDTPSGWTLQASRSESSGADGIDTGAVCTTIFTKIADGTESGTLSVILADEISVSRAQIHRFTKGGGTWAIGWSRFDFSTPADPMLSSPAGGDPSYQAKDMLLVALGVNGNVCVPESVILDPASAGSDITMTEISYLSTGTGADMAWAVGYAAMTATSSGFELEVLVSGTPTANTPVGAAVVLRLRAV
jgi:hypothetical protein